MAFIHTNFLTGNDTTGNGSTTTPYKTIFKALSVAASNDEIKVAGGQLVPLTTGTFNVAFANSGIVTSVSQVGTVLPNDALTWEDNQFGVGKFFTTVSSVDASTIILTTSNFAPNATIAAANMYRLDQWHYSSATAPANNGFEYWNTTAIQPNGRTGIKVTGGWNSDYSSNANGWTGVRQTGGVGGNSFINVLNTLSGGLGNWKDNLVFDKFLLGRFVDGLFFNINQNPVGTTGFGSFAVNRVAAAQGTCPIISSQKQNGQTAVWNPPGDTIKIYGAQQAGAILNIYTIPQEFRPTSVNIDLYQNGISSSYLGYPGVSSTATTQLQGSTQKVNLYYRAQFTNTAYFTYQLTPSSCYFNSITLYANQVFCFRQGSGAAQQAWQYYPIASAQIEDITIAGPSASQSSVNFGLTSTQTIIDLSQEGKNIESVKPGFYVTNGATADAVNPTLNLSRVALTNLSAIQVKDVEGLKTLDLYNNIYYKDEVNNWLRITNASISPNAGSATGNFCWAVLGVITKPLVPFTVTLSCKTDGGDWSQFGIQYGPQPTQIITQAITPTSTFGEFTVTVDPAAYADWDTYRSPLFFGVRVPMYNVVDPAAAPNHFYVQTLSIL